MFRELEQSPFAFEMNQAVQGASAPAKAPDPKEEILRQRQNDLLNTLNKHGVSRHFLAAAVAKHGLDDLSQYPDPYKKAFEDTGLSKNGALTKEGRELFDYAKEKVRITCTKNSSYHSRPAAYVLPTIMDP